MGGTKTAAENRAGFKKFYDNPVNRFRYLKAKTMTRIDNKERCMLRTLRKYGLIDYYKDNTSRTLKRLLKDEMELEPILLTKPTPYVYEDGEISYQSMKAKTPLQAQPLAEREGTTNLLDEDFSTMDVGDQEVYVTEFPIDDDGISPAPSPKPTPPPSPVVRRSRRLANKRATQPSAPKPKRKKAREARPQETQATSQPITQAEAISGGVLPTNLRFASAELRNRMIRTAKNIKLPRNFVFTIKDAEKTLKNPNNISLSTGKPYTKKSIKAMLSRLKTIVRKMNCGANLITCFSNARALKNRLTSNVNGKPVKPKDYLATVIILSNLNPYFASGIGEARLKTYRNIQQELINESQDEQAEKVFEDVVIDWKRILNAFDKEKKKFKQLKPALDGKSLSVKEKNFITDFILLALPVLLDPKRDDFAEVKVLDKGPVPEDKKNYYIRSIKRLYLREFKTDKRYGPQMYNLKDKSNKKYSELGRYIEKSLELFPRSYLVSKSNGEPYANGTNTNRMRYIMKNLGLEALNPRKDKKGKPKAIAFNDLRHSRITYAVDVEKMNNKERRELARRMLHSREISNQYERVLGEGVNSN